MNIKKKIQEKFNKKLEDEIITNLENNDFKLMFESYHAHFEKMLEVQAKILWILEEKFQIKGVFNEKNYYKEEGFERAEKIIK